MKIEEVKSRFSYLIPLIDFFHELGWTLKFFNNLYSGVMIEAYSPKSLLEFPIGDISFEFFERYEFTKSFFMFSKKKPLPRLDYSYTTRLHLKSTFGLQFREEYHDIENGKFDFSIRELVSSIVPIIKEFTLFDYRKYLPEDEVLKEYIRIVYEYRSGKEYDHYRFSEDFDVIRKNIGDMPEDIFKLMVHHDDFSDLKVLKMILINHQKSSSQAECA